MELKATLSAFFALALIGSVTATGFAEPPAADPSTATPGPTQQVTIVANPAEQMAIMAKLLEQDANHVAMRVDTEIITLGDVADYIRAMPVRMASMGYEGVYGTAVEALSRQKIMLLRARAEGADKSPEVARQIAAMSEKIVIDAWLRRKTDVAVTEETLRAWYDRDVAGRPGQEEVKARIIVVPTEERARALIANLRDGGDFAATARTQSIDATAAQGGDLGYVIREAVAPDIAAVIFALDVGQSTAFPVRTGLGYCILRVEGRRQRVAPPFEEARISLEKAARVEVVRDVVVNVMENARVVAPSPLPETLARAQP
jgi:peptidyl-prolyl cis-trans isomerase C